MVGRSGSRSDADPVAMKGVTSFSPAVFVRQLKSLSRSIERYSCEPEKVLGLPEVANPLLHCVCIYFHSGASACT
jgi:hypothetical protein